MQKMKLTAKQVSYEVGITASQVHQLRRTNVISAEKIGDMYLFNPSVIAKIKNRKETRGRKTKVKK
jgi:peptide deformylase